MHPGSLFYITHSLTQNNFLVDTGSTFSNLPFKSSALQSGLAAADWPDHLPWVMLGVRATQREDSGISAVELVYGALLMLPRPLIAAPEQSPEFFTQLFLSCLSSFSPLQSSLLEPTRNSSRLRGAPFVYVRLPAAAAALTPACKGLYRVVKEGEKSFRIVVGGRTSVPVDSIKPHVGGNEPVLGLPECSGHPPTSSSSPEAHG
jgi:hypothetical protein